MRKVKKHRPQGFSKKAWDLLPHVWQTGEHSNLDLKASVIESGLRILEIKNDRDNDVQLQDLKETVEEMMGYYQDAIDVERAKIKYAMYLLRMKVDE